MIEELLENIGVGILVVDADERLQVMNKTLERMFGLSPQAFIGRERSALSKLVPRRHEILTSHGRWLERTEATQADGRRVEMFYDITDRKRMSTAGEVGAWRIDVASRQVQAEPILFGLLGYGADELEANLETWGSLVHPEEADGVMGHYREVVSGERERYEISHRMIHRDGSIRWFLSRGAAERGPDGIATVVFGTTTNITTQKLAEEMIRKSLIDKETLLKEVHHRVKNNLQIVSSLLSMQSRNFHDHRDRDLVLQSENRIRSMALVHEMLYSSDQLSQIDFAEYVSKLTQSLKSAFGPGQVKVQIEVEAAELDLDTAVHLGLILNEIISNALQHAFPEPTPGTLTVQLQQDPLGLHLTVKDDGVGLPAGFELENIQTLGVQLITAVSSQLGAEFSFESDGGTTVRVSVPKKGDLQL